MWFHLEFYVCLHVEIYVEIHMKIKEVSLIHAESLVKFLVECLVDFPANWFNLPTEFHVECPNPRRILRGFPRAISRGLSRNVFPLGYCEINFWKFKHIIKWLLWKHYNKSFLRFRFTANSLIYQYQRYAANRTEVNNRESRSSSANSRPGSSSSAGSQWPSISGPPENYLHRRHETWNEEIYLKCSATPNWTELGSQLEPARASWDRQSSSCYLKKSSSPNTSWCNEYKSKSRTGWSDVTMGYQQQRRGSLQLWQFLVALLDDPANAPCIAWTGRGMEFKLIEPEEVNLTNINFRFCS